MNTNTRPYGQTSGAELIALINAGDMLAIAEAQTHRSVPSVKAALRAVGAEVKPEPAKPARKAARAKKAAPKNVKPIRPVTGPGSRGGDPYKALARVQTQDLPTFSPEQRDAYKAALATAREKYTPAQALALAQRIAA